MNIFRGFITLVGWTLIGISIGLIAFSGVNFMWTGVIIGLLLALFGWFLLHIAYEIKNDEQVEDVAHKESVINEVTFNNVIKDEIPKVDERMKVIKPEGYLSSFTEQGIPTLTSTSIKESVDNKDIIAPGVYVVIKPDGTFKVGSHAKNVHLGIMESITSLNDKAFYMRQSSFMDFIQLDELERWMEYIVRTNKITNVHNTVYLNKSDFSKREMGRIIEFRNIVNDYFNNLT